MLKNYATVFLVIEAILIMLVLLDFPVNSPLYLTIMAMIMISIAGFGSIAIFYAFNARQKDKRSTQLSRKVGAGIVAIFGFLLLRLLSHLTLIQLVSISKLASQVSAVTQVALVLTFFYIQYDIVRSVRK